MNPTTKYIPPYSFDLFGIDHIISLVFVVLICWFLINHNEKIGIHDKSKSFIFFLVFILISLDISEDVVRLFTNHYSIKKDLPLHLCSIGIYVAVFALLNKNKTAFQLIFYWGLVGAVQAILTPDGDFFELRIFFIYSQAYHGALIFSVLWLIAKYDMRMEIKFLPKMLIITNFIAIIIFVINYFLDSNYFFLRFRPNVVSPFVIGEWPFYIISVQFFSIILLVFFIKLQDIIFNQKFKNN